MVKAPELPDGFKDGGDGVAFAFVENQVCDYGRCVQVELYAYQACPNSVYVEGNVLDDGGRVIGYTNDRIGSLKAKRYGLATLNFTDKAGVKVQLTEITCR